MEPNVHMVSWLMASAALSTYMQNLHGNLLLTFPDPISRPKSTTTNMWKCMHYQYLAKQNEGIPFSGHICKIDRIYLRSSKKKKIFSKNLYLGTYLFALVYVDINLGNYQGKMKYLIWNQGCKVLFDKIKNYGMYTKNTTNFEFHQVSISYFRGV